VPERKKKEIGVKGSKKKVIIAKNSAKVDRVRRK